MAKDIVVIVGSLRKESFNRKTANALREPDPYGGFNSVLQLASPTRSMPPR